MAAESNTGFPHNRATLPPRPAALIPPRTPVPFQSGAAVGTATAEMIPVCSYFGIDGDGVLAGNANLVGGSSSNPAIMQGQPPTNSPASSLVFDSLSALNYGNGLPAEWSVEEQYILEKGIQKYANDPNTTKYVKIAAGLKDKTVRDVALRCRWTMRKRRKLEEYNAGKKVKDKKDKLVESSSNSTINISSVSSLNMAEHSFRMHHMDQNVFVPYEVLNCTAKNLLEQNAQVFEQIAANFSMHKLQDNIDLFYQTRYNITAILNDMKNIPGIMSQMPPLPVCINEDLAASILPYTTQTMMFGSLPGIHVKQEPRC